jgi:hypothetical protein
MSIPLAHHTVGEGPPLLLVHGAADDADEHEMYLTRPEVLAAALTQRWAS